LKKVKSIYIDKLRYVNEVIDDGTQDNQGIWRRASLRKMQECGEGPQ
jgi:hypothetical protein